MWRAEDDNDAPVNHHHDPPPPINNIINIVNIDNMRREEWQKRQVGLRQFGNANGFQLPRIGDHLVELRVTTAVGEHPVAIQVPTITLHTWTYPPNEQPEVGQGPEWHVEPMRLLEDGSWLWNGRADIAGTLLWPSKIVIDAANQQANFLRNDLPSYHVSAVYESFENRQLRDSWFEQHPIQLVYFY